MFTPPSFPLAQRSSLHSIFTDEILSELFGPSIFDNNFILNRQLLKSKLYEMWYRDFKNSISYWPSCFFSSPNDLIAASSFEPRYQLTQFITGHCRLNGFLHRIGKVPSSLCHCCKIPETCSHLLFECPLYYTQRMFLSLCLSELGLSFPFSLNLVVSNKDVRNLVIVFLKRTGRLEIS